MNFNTIQQPNMQSQTINTAEKFVDLYYAPRARAKFYQDTTKVIWNGTGLTGSEFKQKMPNIHQEVHGMDCHQLGDLILVNTTGVVKDKRGKKQQFAQTFVLTKQGGLTYIVSDCFRFV
ncbi:NTF2- export protein 2 [Coemansia spiralis]|uniref:NTF2- export protein 2 n=2 Tax=Coemansia TaxID=4863 RepID=A0A9W8KZE4_9FUNG|nr:hypothetical protein BX070DRAFT_264333 [Coemansia spiralis]KAJ1986572.1 NTF2- export protein 2 [Coemansia umbellata]KAJ2623239.1 NTF2- export protein 2 [Coemansia sp. RSA 1358]KAJ2678791.1 NTF2- export protein 2 [Coemansia spiralis]